ncbi:MAG: GFA family protein [Bryobacteraceae bacterium]
MFVDVHRPDTQRVHTVNRIVLMSAQQRLQLDARYCHCWRCQRRTGTAASINAITAPGSLQILAGEDRLRAWKPEDGREKWFCGGCGSAMFSSRPGFNDPMACAWASLMRILESGPPPGSSPPSQPHGRRSLTTGCHGSPPGVQQPDQDADTCIAPSPRSVASTIGR